MIALAGVVLVEAPHLAVWFVALFTLINAGFLAASIAFTARPPPPPDPNHRPTLTTARPAAGRTPAPPPRRATARP